MEKMVIVTPTHKTYIDVFNIFQEIFSINWSNCTYRKVLSTNETKFKSKNFEIIKNKNTDELVRRIYNAAIKVPSKYYLILLEDYFFRSNVEEKNINNTLKYMEKNNIDFCRIIPSPIKKNKQLKYKFIKKTMPYGLNLGGCICSRKFILNQLSENITGWKYEENRLKETLKFSNKDYYENAIRCNYNFLNTIHGISKNKWIDKSFKELKKKYGSINFEIRDVQKKNLRDIISSRFRKLFNKISVRKRMKIKKILEKFGFKFTSIY